MKKAILIDMGDTLIHNVDINFRNSIDKLFEKAIKPKCIKSVFINEAINILNEIFNERKNIEFKMIEYIKLLIDLYDLKFDDSLEALEEDFALNSCQYQEVEGAEKILKYFRLKNYPVILLSNTSFSKNLIIKILGNLSSYFEDIIVSSEGVFRKPSRYFFEQGINKFNFPKDKIYYIGNDLYADIYGAISVNIKPIWFNEKNIKNEGIVDKKDYIEIKKLEELIEMDF